MDDWRNALPAHAGDVRHRLDAFAAALVAFVQTWRFDAAANLRDRADAVVGDVPAREWFEQVLAFEIERCRSDAAPDRVQREMIDTVERVLRERAAAKR